MESWTTFKSLFETTVPSGEAPHGVHGDDSSSLDPSTVGQEISFDHNEHERRGRTLLRQPSGNLYTDENDVEAPNLTLVTSEDAVAPDLQDEPPRSAREEDEDYETLKATSTINHSFTVQEEFPYLRQEQAAAAHRNGCGTFMYRSESDDSEPSVSSSPSQSSLGGVADDQSLEHYELSVESLESFHIQKEEDLPLDDASGSKQTTSTTSADSSISSKDVDSPKSDMSPSPSFDLEQAELKAMAEIDDEKRQHMRWFGHGKLWTLIAIIVSWTGVALAICSRYSLEFVTLELPLYIDPIFDPVDSIGMIRIQVCYNETVAGQTGCETIPLSAETIQDNRFDISRIFLAAGVLFGLFFTTLLTTAIFWDSINLRPIGFGFLFTYFFQSFSMLFFDSMLCNENKCRPGAGCLYCVVASFCWITACVASAKMEAVKTRNTRRRLRRAKRSAKKAARKKFKRENSSTTERTASMSASDSSSIENGNVDIELGGGYKRNSNGTYEC